MDQLSCNEISSVLGYQTNHQQPISAEIVLRELSNSFAFTLVEVHGFQLSFDERYLQRQDHDFHDPVDEVDDGRDCYKEKPEPDEDEDLFVEEVDR